MNGTFFFFKYFFQVFSWGDGEYGKLGHGNSATQKYPKIIQGPLFSKVSLWKTVGKKMDGKFRMGLTFYFYSYVFSFFKIHAI